MFILMYPTCIARQWILMTMQCNDHSTTFQNPFIRAFFPQQYVLYRYLTMPVSESS